MNQTLAQCQQLGIRLWVEGGALRYDAPKGALSPNLLAEIKAHKSELLAALQPQPAAVDPTTMPVMASVVAECEKAFGETVVEWAEEGGRAVGKRPETAPSGWIAPRPTVRCGDCQHFERDTVGDGFGVGACLVKGEGTGRFSPALWPGATRWCKDFEAVTP